MRIVKELVEIWPNEVCDKYLLPLISELVSQLCRARYFTKLDVHWGFNNIRIKPEDKWKAAFRTNQGLFKPVRGQLKGDHSLS